MNTKLPKLPCGSQDFEKLREEGFLFDLSSVSASEQSALPQKWLSRSTLPAKKLRAL
jgi:hypothetical protein